MKTQTFVPCIFAAAALATAAHATVETFDNPVTLSPTQAAGTWYTDRYAPADFQSVVFFDGDNRLRQSIREADGLNNRPGAYASTFYNTQGRKYDLAASTTKMSIDLYVDSTWETSGRRMAGLWGTAVDGANAITSYPIVEFFSNGATGAFQVWTGASFTSIGLPTGFSYNAWSTLSIELVGTNWVTSVGDASLTFDAAGSTRIDNVILQGHNTATGVNYDIYWDNFGSVPAPGVIALLGMAGLVGGRRRRS